MNNCVFCSGEGYPEKIILETDNFLVRAGLGLMSSGHCMIITKKHFPAIADIPEEFNNEFLRLKDLVFKSVSKNFSEPFMIENGIFGQSVPHAHIHIIPTKSPLYDFDPKKYMIDEIENNLQINFIKSDFSGLKDLYKKYGKYRTLVLNNGDFYSIVGDENLNKTSLVLEYRTNFANRFKEAHLAVKWETMTKEDIEDDKKKIVETVKVLSEDLKNKFN